MAGEDKERYCGKTLQQIYEGVSSVVGRVGQRFKLKSSFVSLSRLAGASLLGIRLDDLNFRAFADFDVYLVTRNAWRKIRSRRLGCKHLLAYVYVHRKTRKVVALYIQHQAFWHGPEADKYIKQSSFFDIQRPGLKRWFIFDTKYLNYIEGGIMDSKLFSRFLENYETPKLAVEGGEKCDTAVGSLSFVPLPTMRGGKYYDYSPFISFKGIISSITLALRQARDNLWLKKGFKKPAADFLIRAGVFQHIFDQRIVRRKLKNIAVSEFLMGRLFALGAVYNFIDAVLEDYSLQSGSYSFWQLAHIVDNWENDLLEYNSNRFNLSGIDEKIIQKIRSLIFGSGTFNKKLLTTDLKTLGKLVSHSIDAKGIIDFRMYLAGVLIASFRGYARFYMNKIINNYLRYVKNYRRT